MPLRDPGVFLEDIEHYAAAAIRFTSGLSVEQYLADEKTRAAVERVLEVCGEAMSNLHKVAPAVAQSIPHARDIIGFRNILAHGYAELDHNKVYRIAIVHAPELLVGSGLTPARGEKLVTEPALTILLVAGACYRSKQVY